MQKPKREWTKVLARVISVVLEIKGQIRLKLRSGGKHEVAIDKICLFMDMSACKITPRFFCNREYSFRVNINNIN